MNEPYRRLFVVVATSVLVATAAAWAASQGARQAAGVPLPALCAGLAFTLNWLAFLPAWAARSERYYDLVGSLSYLGLLACALLLGEPDPRAWLLAGMVAVWALRLGSFLFLRIRACGADRRFDAIKQDPARFLVAWTLQALWVCLTLGCALAALTTDHPQPLGAWAAAGFALWLVGFGVEVLADRQKRAFRADPANAERFITSGLWARSRHPNYCGEILLWCGVALAALPALSGWQHATLVSPVFVYLLLTRVSGIPPLEQRAQARWGDDPDYQDYVRRTPRLWPGLSPAAAPSGGSESSRRPSDRC